MKLFKRFSLITISLQGEWQGGCRNFDADLLSKFRHRFNKTESFPTHQEGKDISAGATTKAVKHLPRGIHSKGRRFLVMKRAEATIVLAGFGQGDVPGYDIHDINRVTNVLKSGRGNSTPIGCQGSSLRPFC